MTVGTEPVSVRFGQMIVVSDLRGRPYHAPLHLEAPCEDPVIALVVATRFLGTNRVRPRDVRMVCRWWLHTDPGPVRYSSGRVTVQDVLVAALDSTGARGEQPRVDAVRYGPVPPTLLTAFLADPGLGKDAATNPWLDPMLTNRSHHQVRFVGDCHVPGL